MTYSSATCLAAAICSLLNGAYLVRICVPDKLNMAARSAHDFAGDMGGDQGPPLAPGDPPLAAGEGVVCTGGAGVGSAR